MSSIRIAGVCGSLTQSGRTRTALEAALAAAAAAGDAVQTEMLDLREWRISFLDGRPLDAYEDDTPEAVRRVQDADAVIIATPTYRGTFSGALKNFLDLLPREALLGKPVGLIASGGSPHHFLSIDMGLRPVLAWFGACVLPGSVYVENADFANGALVEERTRDGLTQLGEALTAFTERLRDSDVSPPPLPMWRRG